MFNTFCEPNVPRLFLLSEVICFAEDLQLRELPKSKQRDDKESIIVGSAAQAFNVLNTSDTYPGYLMGTLVLPPGAIKDPEAVGSCAQTFTVVSCQPKALEVSYGDPEHEDGALDPDTAQRYLLGPGDMFRVPPGNCYRLDNHSKTVDCNLTWTIIRSVQPPSDENS